MIYKTVYTAISIHSIYGIRVYSLLILPNYTSYIPRHFAVLDSLDLDVLRNGYTAF